MPFSPLLVGNDIFDLACVDNRASAQNSRYVQRVLSPQEKEIYFNLGESLEVFALLWTAKEAMFKLVQKEDVSLIFAHNKFLVLSIDSSTRWVGSGVYEKQEMQLQWDLTDRFVHCRAKVTSRIKSQQGSIAPAFVEWIRIEEIAKICRKDSSQAESRELESSAGRALVRNIMSEKFQLPDTEIRKLKRGNSNIPVICSAWGQLENFDVSLSHDHRFAAVVVTFANELAHPG